MIVRSTAFAACVVATVGVAQRAEMTVLTPFVAPQALTPEHAEPLGWIDGDHYLIHGRVVAGQPARAFYRVDATAGTRELLFDPKAARVVPWK